jgi:hypothetical protein
MYLLVVTYLLIATGPAAQTPRPPTSPSISTDKIATYNSLNDCRRAAEAFVTDPADRDPTTSGFSYQTRTVCVPIPDADAVAG